VLIAVRRRAAAVVLDLHPAFARLEPAENASEEHLGNPRPDVRKLEARVLEQILRARSGSEQ